MGARIVTTTSNSQFVECDKLRYEFTFKKGFQKLRWSQTAQGWRGHQKPVVAKTDELKTCWGTATSWRTGHSRRRTSIGPYLLMVQKSGEKTSCGTGSLSYTCRVVVWDFWTMNSSSLTLWQLDHLINRWKQLNVWMYDLKISTDKVSSTRAFKPFSPCNKSNLKFHGIRVNLAQEKVVFLCHFVES